MPSYFTESEVEIAALEWFSELGHTVTPGAHIAPGEPAAERRGFGEVVLGERLREAIRRLNPTATEEACEEALRKVLRTESPSLVANNRAFHKMLRDGVSVPYRRKDGETGHAELDLVDFEHPENNDWMVVNQFTVVETPPTSDVVVFLNGLPLGLIELVCGRRRSDGAGIRLPAGADLQGGNRISAALQRGLRDFRRA